MKRTVALTLILVVLLLGAFSSSAGARDAGQLSPDDAIYYAGIALLAVQPAVLSSMRISTSICGNRSM